MGYKAGPPPKDAKQLGAYAEEQLREVSENFDTINNLALVELNEEPVKPRDGMVVLADGSNWDPGEGAGFYGYVGAIWVLLSGAITTQSTRNGLTSISVSSSVNIIRTTGYNTAGDGGIADYVRVGSEPSHNLKVQSSDGAWWELNPANGIIPFQACGGIQSTDSADGAANVTAFDDFIGYAQAFFSSTPNAAGPTLYFKKGDYHFNDHLNVKAQVKIIGDGSWGEIKRGARLHFVADSNGIIVQGSITLDEVTVASGFTGHGTEIDGLHLIGNGFGDTTGHGIWLRAQALIHNCMIEQFGLDGVHIVATIGSGGATEGNANLWRVESVNTRFNGRHGFYVDGNDVNAGYGEAVNANNNGRWGVNDSSFLGNTYDACHTATNGLATVAGNASDSSSLVSFGSNFYGANMSASEADLVATEPGTDETVWSFWKAGAPTATVPLWVASKSEGTYFHGGPYTAALGHAGSLSTFTGCYRENNQGISQVFAPAMILGGFQDLNRASGFTLLGNSTGAHVVGQVTFDNFATHFTQQTRQLELSINIAYEKLLRVRAGASDFMNLAAWDEGSDNYLIGEYANSASARPIAITSGSTTTKSGRDSALPGGKIIFPFGIFVGPSTGNARHLNNATAAATTGDRAQGEFDFNRSPSAGSPAGWHCTTGHASTPTFTALYGVGTQQSNIPDPSGGGTVDTEARTAINSLIAAMEHFGFNST